MKHIITLALLFTLVFAVTAQDDTEADGTIIHIGPYLQNCIGEAPQECMVVRLDDEDDLSFFYDSIDGFTFEEGFEYTLLVNITELENVPADASSLSYELIEVLQQFPASLGGKIWELQSLNGVEIENPSDYTFLMTDDGIVLKADCNTVQADLELNPFGIEITTSTRAMCPEDSHDAEYLAGLNAANLISIENGELILQSSEGQLRFAPPSINGTHWTLTRVLGIAMTLELDDSVAYTLQFDGTFVSMMAACNSGGGSIEVDKGILHFTDLVTTLMFCENDPLMNTFPPEDAVYSINEAGNLILEDNMGTLYEFTAIEMQ